MTINRDELLNWHIPEVRQTYTQRDTMLYALGVGLARDPMDSNELRFAYEKALRALPTMPVVLGYPGPWLADPRTGANWKALLHGEQGFRNARPLPAEGEIVSRTRVTEVLDRGAQKGAMVFTERELLDARSGELLSTLTSTSVLRADGGFGGPAGPAPAPHEIPARAPDHVCDLPTTPQSALIYRLSGDYNALHADPEIAAGAGFPRPILHGLCSFGVAGHALLKTLADYEPERLVSMKCRFTSPVFPGETLRTEMWVDGAEVSFRVTVVERGVVALNNGLAEVLPSARPPIGEQRR